jgi:beta-galactosidase
LSVTLGEQGLVADGQTIPLVSGDIHYWRHSAKDWPMLLDRVCKLGLKMISTYVPWSVHEAGPGTFDWGDLDPSKNLGRFLDLAAERGLKVLVRPGPHINAELTYFGFPPRLFENPIYLARNARGGLVILPVMPRAFPVISYASEAFWKELAGWIDAAASIIGPRRYPNGPICGVQLDNELSYFFRTSAYDQDYHPDARTKWIDFLIDKYGDEFKVSDAYRMPKLAADLVMPDRFFAEDPHDLPFHLDWAEFKERLLNDSLARLRLLWEDRGVRDIVFFQNYPVCDAKSPFNLGRAEQSVDFCGIDFYMHKYEFAALKRKMLFLSGQSRFPVSPEFASGCYQFWPPVDLHDQIFTTKVAWMFGLKGINFYMIVERERWYGSPITRQGGTRRDYWDFYEAHLEMLDRLKPWTLNRQARVCLVSVRDYERLEAATTAIAPVTPLVIESLAPAEDFCLEGNFGFARPIQYLYAKMLRGWELSLTKLGIPYVIGTSEMTADQLAGFDAVVCPTFEFLSAAAQKTLMHFLSAGGKLVCGPEIPGLDERMDEYAILMSYAARPVEKLACEAEDVDLLVCDAGKGEMILVTDVPLPPENMLPVAQVICDRLDLKPLYPITAPCEASLHVGEGRQVLYVANPSPETQRPRITLPTPNQSFIDLETGHRFYGDSVVEMDMPPYSVRILEVRR